MRSVFALLALFALAAPVSAQAQEGAPPRPTTVISQPKPQIVPKPVKAAPPISFARPSSPTSRYASSIDQASQCRAQCAEVHYVCAAIIYGAGGQCDSEWSRCNVRCSGAGYAFHSSAFAPSHQ